jgi:Caulimovirus viroplasmin
MMATVFGSTTMAGWMNRAVAWCWWSSSFGLNNYQNSRTLLCPLAAASSSSSRRRKQQQQQQRQHAQQPQQQQRQHQQQQQHQRQITYSVLAAPLQQSPLLVPHSTKISRSASGKKMAKSSSKKFYAVAKGRKVGIFESWKECASHVNGFKMARFKAFPTRQEAASFLQMNADGGGGGGSGAAVLPPLSSMPPSSSSFQSLERRDSRGPTLGASDVAVHPHQHRQPFSAGEGKLDALHFGSSHEYESPPPMAGANVDGPSSQSAAVRPRPPARATVVNPYQKATHKAPPRKKAEAARGSRRKHSLLGRGGEAGPSAAAAKKRSGSAEAQPADAEKKPDSAASAPSPPLPRRKLTIHINFDGGSRGNPGLAGGTNREHAKNEWLCGESHAALITTCRTSRGIGRAFVQRTSELLFGYG